MSHYKEYERIPLADSTLDDERFHAEQAYAEGYAGGSTKESQSKFQEGDTRIWSRIVRPVSLIPLFAGFVGGILCTLILRFVFPCYSSPSDLLHHSITPPFEHPSVARPPSYAGTFSFPKDIGATEVHEYPPASPTNQKPEHFPTEIGYPGPTATGAEPGLVMTAGAGLYPSWKGTDGLVGAPTWDKHSSSSDEFPSWIEEADEISGKGKPPKEKFNIFHNWGNLSPFYSVPRSSFGIESGPEVPYGCELKGAHILHRHGARYPTTWFGYGSPSAFASRLHAAAENSTTPLKATGALEFLNTWTYKLGGEVLTPFGRQQLFDLGVSMRMKYGSLLEGFKNRLPVFRTESQDRMLASATNFALGFFGWPLENKLLLSVTVEENGYNNTLAPYKTCPNDNNPTIGGRGYYYVEKWTHVYLEEARHRIQKMLHGYPLGIEDIYTMQMMCPYETVALGYSKFCELFTEEEWEGFEYALDLYFWYDSGFGSPVARALGSGYVLEMLSRLTQTPISGHSSPISDPSKLFSVNTTLDSDSLMFPLDQPLYVDATHEVVIVNILTALNVTVLAEDGPPGYTKMKRGRRWITSRIAPFASNVQVQLLQCSANELKDDTQVRIILNDGVVALTGIEGCPEQKDGMCPQETFIKSQKKLVEGSDWEWACHGNWSVPEGDRWRTMTGDPPSKD